jgi:uncharacterized protein YbjT (DUF2867 family)
MAERGGPPLPADSGAVVVTGSLGFVAGHVLPRLHARGARVIGIVRPGRDAAALEARGIEVRRADLSRPLRSPDLFAGAHTILHLSGMALFPALFEAIEASGIRRGVFISSAGVYTSLRSASAEAKRVGEARLGESRIDWTLLRPTMIYGTPADRNLSRLLRWLRACPVVLVPGGGRTLQQPVHVEDLTDAILAALDRPGTARRVYDIGGPEPLPLAEVIRLSAAALERSAFLVPLPLGPSYRLVSLLKRLRLPSPVRGEQVLRLAESKEVDIEAARRDLGFRPRPFVEGIGAEAALLRA